MQKILLIRFFNKPDCYIPLDEKAIQILLYMLLPETDTHIEFIEVVSLYTIPEGHSHVMNEYVTLEQEIIRKTSNNNGDFNAN